MRSFGRVRERAARMTQALASAFVDAEQLSALFLNVISMLLLSVLITLSSCIPVPCGRCSLSVPARQLVFSALLVLVLGPCYVQATWNPTAHITLHSYENICSNATSNHPELEEHGPALLPDALREKSSTWVRMFDAAIRSKDVSTLRSMKAAPGPFELAAVEGERTDQPWFDFVESKIEMFDILENRLGLKDLWRPKMSLLDVGSGHGFVDAYLAAKYGTKVAAVDIPNSYQCLEMMRSPLLIHFFNGTGLPWPSLSFDAVSFMGVLHHAAANQGALLQEAARLARKWVIVVEDLDVGTNHKRNKKHGKLWHYDNLPSEHAFSLDHDAFSRVHGVTLAQIRGESS